MLNIKQEILSKRYICYVFKIISFSDNTLDFIASKLKSGINFIQLVQGNISSKQFYDIALKIKQLCSFFDAILVIQDRIDIALLVNADGVFLDENSIDIKLARKLLKDDIIIGKNYISGDISDYYIFDTKFDNHITYTKNGEYKVIYDCK